MYNQILSRKNNFLENISDLSFHHDNPIATISLHS